jgi:hypothetical protein
MDAHETDPLIDVYLRLRADDRLDGSHVSIDRDRRGEETVTIAPDWVEGPVLAGILEIARECEVEVALTGDGLRLAAHTNATSRGVSDVKRVLREHAEPDPD